MKCEIFQLAPFNSEENTYRESTDVILTDSSGRQILSKSYIDIDKIFWLNDRYAIVSTSGGENITSSSAIDRIDTLTSKAETINSSFSLSFGGGGPGGECVEEPGCACAFTVFILQNRIYYLSDERPFALYRVLPREPRFNRKYPDAKNNNCSILDLKSVQLLQNFPDSKTSKIASDFYEGLKFSIDKKSYVIPWDQDIVTEAH